MVPTAGRMIEKLKKENKKKIVNWANTIHQFIPLDKTKR